jgi:hypothetical protein
MTNAFGLKWMEFNKNNQLVTKQKFFTTEMAMEKFIIKLFEKGNFHSILTYLK